MTDQPLPLLLRAARWLEIYAADLQTAYTIDTEQGVRWPDNDNEHREAHRNHDELLETAKALRAAHRGEIAASNDLNEALNSGDVDPAMNIANDHLTDDRACLVCCGEGYVDGADYYDWQDDEYYDAFSECPSCHGSGLAKDMTWC